MKIILKAFDFYVPLEKVSAFQDTPAYPDIKSKIYTPDVVGFSLDEVKH